MVELKFSIISNVFSCDGHPRRTTISPLTLICDSVEEAALLSDVDEMGHFSPRSEVFITDNLRSETVIEGFQDCALGEFVKAQLEALSLNGESPASCEIVGLDPFLNELGEPEQAERIRDLISVCEYGTNKFSRESAIRFLQDSGFFEEYIIVGVKRGNGWRRSRCITTLERNPADAATILAHLAEYFGKAQGNDKPKDDQRQ